jgi:hypothetical protein
MYILVASDASGNTQGTVTIRYMTKQSHIRFAKRVVVLMDMKFSILGFTFGLDPLLDIIPGFGDMLGACVSCYLFWIAFQLKVPTRLYVRMLWNIIVDYLLGLIPFINVVLDALYRANMKNFKLLEQYVDPDILEGEVI